jgi:hypothetical protein
LLILIVMDKNRNYLEVNIGIKWQKLLEIQQ